MVAGMSETLTSALSHTVNDPHAGHLTTALKSSILMVIGTEIGDKTFFMAAILAMSKPPLTVFFGCWGALAFMTVASAFMGLMIPTLLSPEVSRWGCVILFAWFGLKSIYDAYFMWKECQGNKPSDELQETEKELCDDRSLQKQQSTFKLFGTIFVMTIMAEMGDKSQLATVVMGGSLDVAGVILGGILGHSLCTGLAVNGGKVLSQSISELQVTAASGMLFLFFAAHHFMMDPNSEDRSGMSEM